MITRKHATGDVLFREMPLALAKREAAEGEKVDANVMRFSASSETPVMRWGDAEILRHDATAVRLERLRSLGSALVNHDANQRAATIVAADVKAGRLDVEVRFGSTEFAQQIRQEVADGLLRGVSIGYRVYTWEVDEEKRTYTATDWEPFEVTFTPIPADPSVGPGRSAEAWGELVRSIVPRRDAATPEVRVSEIQKTPTPQGNEAAATPNSETQRAAIIAEQREIAAQAKSLGLDAGDFVGKTRAEAKDAMLVALAARNATPEPKQPVAAVVTRDAVDKARDAFTGGLATLARVGGPKLDPLKANNPLAGRSLLEMVRRYAKLCGLNTEEWSREDVAYFALGRTEMMSDGAQRAASTTTGQFPNFVFLNAITKILARGFESGSAQARYRRIVDTQVVPDFKQFSVGSLSVGNLQKTIEGMAFPELDKAEGVYNSTVKSWGGTLSLSLQALVSDDTASFERKLRNAGAIADKTIDRRVFQKLLMGTSTSEATSTWTNNTTSGGSLAYTTADTMAAARGKIALVRAALMNKLGKDGNPIGTLPRFLLCGPTSEVNAQAIVGQSGPALQAGAQQAAVQSMEVIASAWLEAAALIGNSTTSYYLLADPMDVTGLVLSYVRGFESVQVTPYDAGAVAGFNWKLWLPFEADLVTDTVSTTTIIPAAQQGTT